MMLVQQVREVGPCVVRRDERTAASFVWRVRALELIDARRWIVFDRALRRPLRYHEQMFGQTPRRVRFEHVVLKNEIVGVRPVIRQLSAVVIAHDVRRIRTKAARIGVHAFAFDAAALRTADETIHASAVDVEFLIASAVWAANSRRPSRGTRPHVDVAIGHALVRACAWECRSRPIRAEVAVERTAFMITMTGDLVIPSLDRRSACVPGRRCRRAVKINPPRWPCVDHSYRYYTSTCYGKMKIG